MEDERKTKKQLIEELHALRHEHIEQTRGTSEIFTQAFLQNSIPTGITTLKEGRFVDVSDAFLNIMGRKRNEVIGHTSIEMGFIKAEQRVHFLDELNKRGRVENLEMEVKTKGGMPRCGLFNAVMLTINNEKYLLTVIIDITERKQVEEALRESEEKYRSLLDNASDAILLADIQGKIVEANRKAEELFGYAKEELLQMHYTQLHPLPERERTMAAFQEIIEKNTDHLSGGYIQRKDGEIVPVDITCNVTEYAGRKVGQASFRNISEHKRAEDTLEKLVRERTTELAWNNEQLKLEIKERKQAEAAMKEKTTELKQHADKLREMNTALKVLLKQREDDKNDLEEKVTSNVKELLLPYIAEMKNRKIDSKSKVSLSILETNLQNIISPFTQRLSSKYLGLTPREVQVADLIRQGKSTKEIAKFIGISASAISIYRYHIREKLGLIEQKINLKTYLQNLS